MEASASYRPRVRICTLPSTLWTPFYEPLQGEGLTPIHECSTTLEDEDEEAGGGVRQGVGVGVFPHVYTSPFLGDDSPGVGEGSEGVGEGGGAFLSPMHEGHLLMTTDLDVYLSESGSGPNVHHLHKPSVASTTTAG